MIHFLLRVEVRIYSVSWVPEKKKKSNTFQDYWKDTNTNAKYQAENTELDTWIFDVANFFILRQYSGFLSIFMYFGIYLVLTPFYISVWL